MTLPNIAYQLAKQGLQDAVSVHESQLHHIAIVHQQYWVMGHDIVLN